MTGLDFQFFLLPLLESLGDGEAHPFDDVIIVLSRHYELTDESLKPLIQGSNDNEINNAAMQAKEHLAKAGLIESEFKDSIRITSLGKIVLQKKLNSLDIDYLRRLPGYR